MTEMDSVSEAGDQLPTDRPHLFEVLVDWSIAHGGHRINELPGCWERTFPNPGGGEWHVALNGHREAKEAGPKDGMRCPVDPFTAMVWWNGWLAGDVHPRGWQIAAGAAANEASFRAAIAADTVKR